MKGSKNKTTKKFFFSGPSVMVARFSLEQHTKTGKIYQKDSKYTKWPQDIPNGHRIYQMAVK
jgi:hypothetical protein